MNSMARLTLSEVILENFMSYEYARVQLNRGLNLISGPNGAGKSSILLAISVATGQSYTERSRKLSDLIRRGKETARVTLVLNNAAVDGKRPVPLINSDLITVSRYLKKDGTYWFEINSKEASKFDVNRLFKSVGMNPDNMLIIMHQNMIEEFAITSPEEKLRMVEEAVGFLPYRNAI
ncbi:MAG: AAA family ATPase, partial [Clostridia bacterium]|nr:AAA family ATPase [Clostridia bacterium]